jgi:hypothetical protein
LKRTPLGEQGPCCSFPQWFLFPEMRCLSCKTPLSGKKQFHAAPFSYNSVRLVAPECADDGNPHVVMLL